MSYPHSQWQRQRRQVSKARQGRISYSMRGITGRSLCRPVSERGAKADLQEPLTLSRSSSRIAPDQSGESAEVVQSR